MNALGRVAYGASINGNPEVFVINGDGSGSHRLDVGGISDSDPTYTPDNGSILFSHNSQIYKMTASGTGLTNLDDGAANDYQPVQSATGLIAFTRLNPTTLLDEIWTMNANGTNKLALYTSPGNHYAQPSFSPDGTKLVFVASPSAGGFQSIIELVLATGETVQLTQSTANVYDVWPCFSPDGQYLLFGRNNNSGGYIMKASQDGFGAVPVYSAPSGAIMNRIWWSPYLANKLYVGTGGTFGTTSNGFVLAQQNDVITSFVNALASTGGTLTIAADASTPNVMRITPTSGTVKTVQYANGFFAGPVTVNAGTAKQVVVSFDSLGHVSLVIPVTKMGPGISGALAVYDSRGKNLAPRGASEVLIGTNGNLAKMR